LFLGTFLPREKSMLKVSKIAILGCVLLSSALNATMGAEEQLLKEHNDELEARAKSLVGTRLRAVAADMPLSIRRGTPRKLEIRRVEKKPDGSFALTAKHREASFLGEHTFKGSLYVPASNTMNSACDHPVLPPLFWITDHKKKCSRRTVIVGLVAVCAVAGSTLGLRHFYQVRISKPPRWS
jgi:hypothetical protein